jgi:hypothetical protein
MKGLATVEKNGNENHAFGYFLATGTYLKPVVKIFVLKCIPYTID